MSTDLYVRSRVKVLKSVCLEIHSLGPVGCSRFPRVDEIQVVVSVEDKRQGTDGTTWFGRTNIFAVFP